MDTNNKAIYRVPLKDNDEKGIFLLLVAIALVSIFGVIALGIDGGRVFLSGLKQQRSADVAALSAAHRIGILSNAEVKAVALQVARDNFELNNTPYDNTDLGTHFIISDVVNGEISVETKADVPTFIAGKVVPGDSTIDVRTAASALRNNVAVTLVIDNTGSMGNSPPGSPLSKLELTKIAAKNFVSQFSDNDRIGVVTYSTVFDDVSSIRETEPKACQGGSGRTIQDIQDRIDNIQDDGWTNIHLGLLAGLRDMENWLNRVGAFDDPNDPDCAPTNRRSEYQKRFIVLMTDGTPNRNIHDNPINNANEQLIEPTFWFPNYDPNNYDPNDPNNKPLYDYPDSLSPPCAGDSTATRYNEDYVRAQQAADFIRQHGHVVLTVSIGPSTDSVSATLPWGDAGVTRIRPNFMRWLANDAITATENNDLGFPASCNLPTYDDMETSQYPHGLALHSDDPTDVDGLFQQAASYITLRLTS